MRVNTSALKRARQRADLTQGELARRTGMDQGHYSRVERGASGVSRETLLAIARVLQIPVASLLEEGNEPSPSAETTAISDTARGISVDYTAPAGLRELVKREALLVIEPAEWSALREIARLWPNGDFITADGWTSILAALRAASRAG